MARIMPNLGGPKQSKRKLYASVVNSILLYGNPIWADCLKKKWNRLSLARAQRWSALKVASAYSAVSGSAVLVIAGRSPIDLLVEERRDLYECTG